MVGDWVINSIVDTITPWIPDIYQAEEDQYAVIIGYNTRYRNMTFSGINLKFVRRYSLQKYQYQIQIDSDFTSSYFTIYQGDYKVQDGNLVYDGGSDWFVGITEEVDDEWRYITITEEVTDENFKKWLIANATKVSD